MATLVTMHVWRAPRSAAPRIAARLILDRPAIRGLQFAKLLGTGSGDTFTARDADLTRWALLACWQEEAAAEAFERGRAVRGWDAIASERARITLRPVRSRGSWAGKQPFADTTPAPAGPVAALTRAKVRPTKMPAFWRAVPPVAHTLRARHGLLFRMGIGEAPVRTPGTFSVWSSSAALDSFAYQSPEHAEVIRRTPAEGWYAEELFARFAVLAVDGTVDGRAVLTGAP